MTNIESKFIALQTALILKDADATNVAIQGLAHTERNFVLKKGESTVDLERGKIDNQHLKDTLEAISGIIPNSRPKD